MMLISLFKELFQCQQSNYDAVYRQRGETQSWTGMIMRPPCSSTLPSALAPPACRLRP